MRFISRIFRKNGEWIPNPCNGGSWRIWNLYYTAYDTIEYNKKP